MGVDGRISGSTRQVLVFTISDVHSRTSIPKLLGQPEVDQEQFVAMPPDTHQKVVRFDVAMDERLTMDVFYATDHLIGQHQHRFDGETARTEIEEIFEGRSQQVHHEDVVVLLLAIVSAIEMANLAKFCMGILFNKKKNEDHYRFVPFFAIRDSLHIFKYLRQK